MKIMPMSILVAFVGNRINSASYTSFYLFFFFFVMNGTLKIPSTKHHYVE